jgi:transcriptional regulator with XRE-family HTH domain
MGGPGSGRKPNLRRRRRVAALRARGLSLGAIARALGVSREGASRMLRAAGMDASAPPVRCPRCRAEVLTPEPGGRPPPALCLACLEDWPEAPFGQRLRAYRLAAGLSQEGLGRRLGVDVASVSRWEKGVNRPRTPLHRLAEALGVEPGELLPGGRSARG